MRAPFCRLGMLLAATAVLAAGAFAQDAVRWTLPQRGAALYDRTLRVDAKVEPDGPLPELPWTGPVPAALVLAAELDDARQCSREPVFDPRELLAALCLDLATAHAGTVKVPVVGPRLGRRDLVATWGAVAADGSQTVEAELGPLPQQRAGGRAAPPKSPALHATVRGTRRVDAGRGLVAAFRGTIELRLDVAKGTVLHCTLQDEWTAPRTLAPDDAAFRAMVNDGIERATGSLERQLDSFCERAPEQADDVYRDAEPGTLALLLLALVKGGADPRQARIAAAFDDLRKRRIEGTYSLAVALLALEALYTPPGEWQHLREGTLDRPAPRALSDADREVVRAWTAALLDNVDSKADAATVRRWSYGPAPQWDNSNSQFAMLGLYAAQLCGADVPPRVFAAAAKHWLDSRVPAGADAVLQLATHADLRRVAAGGRPQRGRRVTPCGWGYVGGDAPTGTMTSGGIAGLVLCGEVLRQEPAADRQLLRQVDDAVRGGFLWLQQNLSVRRNPGPAASVDAWHYYWLYGLERACELTGTARLGERDWYFEGALRLLQEQQPGGSWGTAWDSCFALLFLKKAALPTATPR